MCVCVCVSVLAGIGLVHWFVSAFRIFHEPEMYRWSRSVFSFSYFSNERAAYALCAHVPATCIRLYASKHYTLEFMLSIKSH